MSEPTTAEIREWWIENNRGSDCHNRMRILLDKLEVCELERNAAIQGAVVNRGLRVKAELERDELDARRDELLVVIAEMKQAMSFDWDLFKSTQESLREHVTILRKISELQQFSVPLAPDGNKAVWVSGIQAIIGKHGE